MLQDFFFLPPRKHEDDPPATYSDEREKRLRRLELLIVEYSKR